MSDWEVSRSAALLITKHGNEAAKYAERQADVFLGFGHERGSLFWHDVARRIVKMQATAVAVQRRVKRPK